MIPLETDQKAVQQGSNSLCLPIISPNRLPTLVYGEAATIYGLVDEKWVKLRVSLTHSYNDYGL